MTARRFLLCWLLAWLLLPALAQAAEVQATLDRNQVQLGETVTLNLRVQGGGSVDAPDLAALAQDFDVLGTSSNTSVSIVNGARSAELTYGIALRPKHVGQLRVPPLAFAGGRTSPLQLQVVAPDPQANADGSRDVFVEASAQPGKVYVGQQLLFTVRLYFTANLTNGALDDPQLAGVDVRKIGSDLNYDAERGGRRYHVVERRYAMIPQRAGRIDIPPVAFQGELADPNDPDSFFGMGTATTAASPPTTVEVQPAPAGWGGAAWLPARQLQLTLDGLPADGKLRVGQSLTLTMTLQATGLPYEALPALSLPSLDGATVYPDKPVTGTRGDGQWIVGRRQQDFAVVPDRAGTLTIPETTLKWWNVLTGKAEVARIPAQHLTVLAADGSRAPAPAPAATTGGAAPAASLAPAPAASHRWPWGWLAAGALAVLLCIGLLGIGVGWWMGRRAAGRRPGAAAPMDAAPRPASARQLRAAFMAAARGDDPAAQARSLLAWARTERPGLPHLGALAAALAAEPQRAAIAALQRRQYADAAAGASPGLAEAFAGGFAWREASGGGDDAPLPPLYPFKLR
ncbi:hypothetical protein ASG87_02465 [Frateuria sp. Soil773]|uniref:BatD family protein n=1 Tax=Frateuria sp. Soil773 TaxID=1736407 RepID=UPI0006FF3C78|nr:BatD family protein [Frateuria sp. Soil773]KRE89831.1 hypothetical protein ASG87_02465 [Frateuria sp. Soil773]